MYQIGVDGGGTKTRFTAFDRDMKQIASVVLGAGNILQIGDDGLSTVLHEGVSKIENALREPASQRSISLGLAGYGRDRAVQVRIERAARTALGDRLGLIVSDVQSAHAGALALCPGITVIAGTGSIAYGTCGDVDARSGGWGYKIGDEGSAYWIARKMLGEFSKQADGRELRTPLFDAVMDAMDIDEPYQAIMKMQGEYSARRKLAGLAARMGELVAAGDDVAMGIWHDAARELASLVRAVRAALPFGDGEVIHVGCVGGVLVGNELVRAMLAEELGSFYRVSLPCYSPDAGACLLLR